jgi:hypothetical protein
MSDFGGRNQGDRKVREEHFFAVTALFAVFS